MYVIKVKPGISKTRGIWYILNATCVQDRLSLLKSLFVDNVESIESNWDLIGLIFTAKMLNTGCRKMERERTKK